MFQYYLEAPRGTVVDAELYQSLIVQRTIQDRHHLLLPKMPEVIDINQRAVRQQYQASVATSCWWNTVPRFVRCSMVRETPTPRKYP